MFVPCGDSAPDLAGFTFLMVSPRFLELRLPGLGCFLSGGAGGSPPRLEVFHPLWDRRWFLLKTGRLSLEAELQKECVGAVTKRF